MKHLNNDKNFGWISLCENDPLTDKRFWQIFCEIADQFCSSLNQHSKIQNMLLKNSQAKRTFVKLSLVVCFICLCFVRLQQLDQHCQASSQQVLQLLSRQKQLMQERQQLAQDMHNLQVQVSLCYRTSCNLKPDDWLKVFETALTALPTVTLL